MSPLTRTWRALPLAALTALTLTAAPAQAACPSSGCGGDGEPTPIKPIASVTGPETAVRTETAVFLDARSTNLGEDGDGVPAVVDEVAWDIDGVTGYDVTGTDLTHTFTVPKGFKLGNLTVRVKVTTTSGVDTDTHVIAVQNRKPESSVASSDATPVVGQTVTFTGTATDADSDSVGHLWDKGAGFCDPFGDVTCLSGSFQRAFGAPGTYTIVHRAHDSDVAHADASTTVTVRARPTAALGASANPAVAGEPVTLDAGASTGQGARTYRWDVDGDAGNGFEVATGTASTLTSTFSAGTRAVRVQVADDEGVTADSAALDLLVHAAPTAAFSFAPAAPVAGTAVTFDATASTDDGAITKVEWDLDGEAGNGFEHDAGTNRTVQWTYATAGERTVRLRVTDDRGVQRVKPATFTVSAPATKPGPTTEQPGTGDEQPGKDDTPGGGKPATEAKGGEQGTVAAGSPATPAAGVAAASGPSAGGQAPEGATSGPAAKAKRACRAVKVKRKGRTVKKRVCAKKKAAKKTKKAKRA